MPKISSVAVLSSLGVQLELGKYGQTKQQEVWTTQRGRAAPRFTSVGVHRTAPAASQTG